MKTQTSTDGLRQITVSMTHPQHRKTPRTTSKAPQASFVCEGQSS